MAVVGIGADLGSLVSPLALLDTQHRWWRIAGLNKILGTIHAYPTWSEANKYVAGNWKKVHASERLLAWLVRQHTW